MLDFEKPANQSEENIQRRCNIAKELYMDWLSTRMQNELTVSVPEKEDHMIEILTALKGIQNELARLTEAITEMK